VDLAAGGEPGGEAAAGELPDAGGAGRDAGVEQAGDPQVESSTTHRPVVAFGAPAQVAGRAVGVDSHGAWALVLGPQRGLPVGEAVGGMAGGHVSQVGHARIA
jgi:hypothetical protein